VNPLQRARRTEITTPPVDTADRALLSRGGSPLVGAKRNKYWEPSVEPDYQYGFQRMAGAFREGGLPGLAASAKEEFGPFPSFWELVGGQDKSPGWGTLASVEGVLSPEEAKAAERGAVRQVVDLLSHVPVFGRFVKPSYAMQTFGRDIAEGNYLSVAQSAAQLGGLLRDVAWETGRPQILLPPGERELTERLRGLRQAGRRELEAAYAAAQRELEAAAAAAQRPLFRRHAALFQTAINSAEAAINEFFASKGPGIVQGDSPGPPYEGQILLPPPVEETGIPPPEDEHIFETYARVARVRAHQKKYDEEFLNNKLLPFIYSNSGDHTKKYGGMTARIFRSGWYTDRAGKQGPYPRTGPRSEAEPLLEVSTWGWEEPLKRLGFERITLSEEWDMGADGQPLPFGAGSGRTLWRFPRQWRLESGGTPNAPEETK